MDALSGCVCVGGGGEAGENSVKMVSPFICKGVYSERKEFDPLRVDRFALCLSYLYVK